MLPLISARKEHSGLLQGSWLDEVWRQTAGGNQKGTTLAKMCQTVSKTIPGPIASTGDTCQVDKPFGGGASHRERLSGPTDDMREQRKCMFHEELFSDVRLSLHGKDGEIAVDLLLHRSVLACCCDYFRSMFTREFNVSGQTVVVVKVAQRGHLLNQ
jgi:hypothetical protein